MLKILNGWSNHCMDITACLRAIRYNIDYLEIHVTDDSSSFAIDNKVSLTYEQVKELVNWARLYENQKRY